METKDKLNDLKSKIRATLPPTIDDITANYIVAKCISIYEVYYKIHKK